MKPGTPASVPPRSCASPLTTQSALPVPVPEGRVSYQAGSSQKEAHLENVCKSLQQQVSQLQEVLTSVSNYVFQGGTNDDLGSPSFIPSY